MNIYTPITITEEIERNFKPTRLAVKELNGLKYFCKSTLQDFETYTGSGVHWKHHVKKHGKKNVKTLWVSDWFYCPHHLQEFALMYSEYNQVVESEQWANLKAETGLDGNCNPVIIKAAMNRPEVKAKRKETDTKPEVRARRSAALTEVASRPETQQKRSDSAKKFYEDEKNKDRVEDRKNKMKAAMADTEVRQTIASSVSKSWETSRETRAGKNHFRYDFTIYSFAHDDGTIENCTRRDLLAKYPYLDASNLHSLLVGRYKSHRGWRILK